ncbi:MAG: hypothetical protein ACR2G0_04765 [Chthoniobacterales bacterium]
MTRIPLTDLGTEEYLGFPGGLYPEGKNSRPAAHENAGVTLGKSVRPLDREGRPSADGKIVMLSIGMSNASREFSQLIRLAGADLRRNPALMMIDAARDGAAATEIASPFGDYWPGVDQQLERGEVTAEQVQIVWLKTALASESRVFPENAKLLQRTLRSIVGMVTRKFRQLKLIYVSSRSYGGYSTTALSPEPIAYESAFAVKWLIEERLTNPASDRSTPWVSWGPYLWADGLRPRSDGLIWERSDFEADGVHNSAQGALKVALMLLEFFQKDATAKPWYDSVTQ